jgi:hypothetical protein
MSNINFDMGAELKKAYREAKAADHPMQTCKKCKQRGPKKGMDPHHTSGRQGPSLLVYVWVCRPCHRHIHEFPAQAEKEGLLTKGRNIQPKQ